MLFAAMELAMGLLSAGDPSFDQSFLERELDILEKAKVDLKIGPPEDGKVCSLQLYC